MARHETLPMTPHPGMILGKLRLESLLGRGGMASVWLATHIGLNSRMAVKVLDPKVLADDPQYERRFLREAQLAAQIHHPNLVSVSDVGRDPDTKLNYLVMEYLPGGTLTGLIRARGALPEAEATRIVRQVASALCQAERFHLVHRDIKPDNILFGEHGEAKLADLGIAKADLGNHVELTQVRIVCGTAGYISPEQARDSGKVDARADIYSLGAVFYEMLAARRPYGGDTVPAVMEQICTNPPPNLRTLRPDVSERTSVLIHAMLSTDAAKRPQTARALLEALGGEPPAAETEPPPRTVGGAPIVASTVASPPQPPAAAGKTKVSNPGMATTIPLDRPAPSARSVRIRSATSRIFSRQTVSAVTLASIAGVLLCVLGWLVLRESAVRAKVLGPPPAETPPEASPPAAPPTSPVPPPTSAREPVAAALPAAPEARAEAPAPKPMVLTLWLGGEAITEATVTLFPEEGAPIRLTGAPYVADLPAGARFDLRVEAGHQGAARWRAAEASGLVAAGHVAFRGLEPAEARRVRVRGFQVVSGGAPVAEVRGTLLQYGGSRVFGPCAPEELAGFLRAFAALDGRFALRFDDADGRPLARFDMALAKPEAGDATPLLAGVRLDLATGAVTLYEEGSDE